MFPTVRFVTKATFSVLATVCLSSFISAPAAASPDLLTVLPADQPSVLVTDNSNVISRLIGKWKVDYRDISKSGNETRRTGKIVVGWIMDGRAIQDVWIVDPSSAQKEREIYSDVFYFDPKSRTWPAVSIDPEAGSVAEFTSETQGNSIVLHTKDLGAKDVRWTFGDLRTTSFVFRDEASDDGGQTWRLRSEYHMTRSPSDHSARE